MPETPYCLEYYRDDNGREPFREWLYGLRDRAAIARITVRLGRVELGNLGIGKGVGSGVCELKIDYGPGYRVYFAMRGKTVCCYFWVATRQHKCVILKRQRHIGQAARGKTRERNDTIRK